MTDTSVNTQLEQENPSTTHFGFTTVAKEEKVQKVAQVFHSVAAKYDLMNDLMSGGIHRIWKRFTIDCSGARPGQRILDLGGGTGDLTAKFSRIVGEKGHVVLADINNSMLNVGRDKLRDSGIVGNVHYVQANAEELPFPDDYFDAITISFCLRNVTDKDKALRSMYRVLKPGGRLLVLEFSKPTLDPLSKSTMHTLSTYCRKWVSWWQTMQRATATWLNPFACTQIKRLCRV
ncbi:ubiquinone/menaquinone biosynthesis methyltransferase UbiE [Vibrio astriarenae]|nr:ubiquinone/menaquinone biosynthesis methyltransferase UbiE [Vibrio sp. C7]